VGDTRGLWECLHRVDRVGYPADCLERELIAWLAAAQASCLSYVVATSFKCITFLLMPTRQQPVRAWMPRPPFARSYTAILWRWAPIVAIYTLRTLVSLGLEQVKVTSEVHVDQGLAAHLLLLT
jgi:hypothetical protein